MRKQTRPCAWHLNSARPGYFGKRVARGWPWAGPEPSPSLLSLSTKRICNNHHDGTILIPLQLIFLLICVTWPEMQIGLFYNLDVAHSRNSLEKEPNWACITKTVLTGKIAFVCQKWKLVNNCGMKFRQRLDFPPNISPTCPLQIHAQSPSFMHSSGLDLIGNY